MIVAEFALSETLARDSNIAGDDSLSLSVIILFIDSHALVLITEQNGKSSLINTQSTH